MTTTHQIQVLRPVKKSAKRKVYELRKLVFTFASQQAKRQQKEPVEDQLTWSQILKAAWVEIKINRNKYQYIEFEKVDGTIAKRVILSKAWIELHEVKGTGRPLKEGQRIYTDAIKYLAGDKYDSGKYYEENLIDKF